MINQEEINATTGAPLSTALHGQCPTSMQYRKKSKTMPPPHAHENIIP
jgi:hypothetical protein